jgi:AcrR family transcriptional regulator
MAKASRPAKATPRTGSRSYRSSLRQERAEDTRERIVTAARELFAARGIDGATVAAIAAKARVATPTVFAAFGSKQEIMAALLARTEHDAHAPTWASEIAAEARPARKLELFAAWSRELFTASRDILGAVHRGPAVTELAAVGDRRRRRAIEALVAGLAEAGALRDGLTPPQAADRAWILTGPEVYLHAASCGWTAEQYQEWLAGLLAGQLLPGANDSAGQGVDEPSVTEVTGR